MEGRVNACKRAEGGRDECRKVKHVEGRINARKCVETRGSVRRRVEVCVDAQKVVGMSAERSSVRKGA